VSMRIILTDEMELKRAAAKRPPILPAYLDPAIDVSGAPSLGPVGRSILRIAAWIVIISFCLACWGGVILGIIWVGRRIL
jgi:hypothetical protein